MPMNPRLLVPRATGFNPRSIANCVLWLDASTTGSLGNTSTGVGGVTDNGPVKFLRDQAGSGNATNSGADSVVPTFKAASLNNRGSLDFDGGDSLIGDLSQTYTGQTVFAVARITVAAAAGNNLARLYTQSPADFTADPDFGSAGKYMPLIRSGTSSAIASWADNAARAVVNITQNVWFIACSRHTGSQIQNSLNSGTAQTYNHSLNYTVGKYRLCSDLSSFGTALWQGGVAEVITYARSISDAERAKVEGYLAWKWGLQAQLPSNHPYAYSFPGFGSQARPSNADALAWESAVYSNSGSVSVGTLTAVNDFCSAIDAAGIRDRFYRLNLMCGTGLNAALVPLYRGPVSGGTTYGNSTDTNNGPFVSGDYTESVGLDGNQTTKYLNTGLAPDDLSAGGVAHLAVYKGAGSVGAATLFLLGSTSPENRNYYIRQNANTDIPAAAWGSGGIATASASDTAAGHFVLSRETSAATGAVLYKNAASLVTGGGATIESNPNPIVVFNLTNGNGTVGTSGWPHVIASYSVGLGLSSSEVTAYDLAVQEFQQALGRA